jgi:tyrocidine synthetase-3
MNERKRKTLLDFRLFDQKKMAKGNLVQSRNDFIEFKKEDINQSIGACFREKQGRYREKVAVTVHDGSITYGFLNNYANRVAHRVVQDYDGANNFQAAALLFDHGIEMIIGLMGTIISGKTYVPLDTGYPLERLGYMLENSEAAIIVTHSRCYRLAETLRNRVNKNIKLINIDGIDPNESTTSPKVSIDPDQVAYVLYTSGSTGKPKGVMQSHKNVLHFARVYTNALHIHQEDRLTLFSSYGFDAAKMDIFSALLNGATLFPLDIKQGGNLHRLPQWLQNEKITIYHSIPTVYRYFTDLLTNKTGKENSQETLFPHLRFIVLGGEPVYKNDVETYKKYFPDDCIFINGLGPTESTVTLQYFIDKQTQLTQEAVPVGFPAEETEVFLLDEHDRESVVNEVGEIIYKSDYLALGYLKMPQKTNIVFGTDPLTGQGRVYRSGDLGRRLEDSSIQYVGRKDFQVKIRGYRIELGEIESKLDCLGGIKKGVVVCQQNQADENFLVAYYQCDEGKVMDEYELVRQLKKYLPGYMIPGAFFRLESFPLTTTGKIDRNALLEQTSAQKFNLSRVKYTYTPPRGDIEEKLVEIWAAVLRHPKKKIGVHDNFFELGGHSLKAILLISRIHKELKVKLSLEELFKSPFIRKLAQTINKVAKDKFTGIIAAEKKEFHPLAPAQKRLYILKQLDPGNTVYNITTIVTLEGEIDKHRLEQTCRKLIRRHESLRTSFHMIFDKPVQRIHENFNFEIEYFDFKIAINQFLHPFDLSQAPLVRVGLVELPHTPIALGGHSTQEGGEHKYILMIDMHHIVSDLTSLAVFINDFAAYYQDETRPELRFQYKDYWEWQNKVKAGDSVKKQEQYWLKQFGIQEEIPVLNLPFDYPRPIVQDFAGRTLHFEIGEKETTALKSLALKEEVTLFMVLLSCYDVLLSKLSGQQDIIVGIPIAARRHADLGYIIGMFVNTLGMRNFPYPERSFIEFLQEVKKRTLNAYENQEYPFEDLVEKVKANRDASRNPLFDVMFVLQNMEIPEVEIPGLKLKPYEYENRTSKFDVTLRGEEKNKKLSFALEYGTKLFKQETILRFSRYFKKIVYSVLQQPEQEICELEIITGQEKRQVLYDFNETGPEYPHDKTIQQLFAQQVKQTPGYIALYGFMAAWMLGEGHITYSELNKKSNQLAFLLKEKGVGPDTITAIMMERSLEMIVAILGILGAGGAYLPIDPGYPPDRINYMLADSKAKVLLAAPGTQIKAEVEERFKEILNISNLLSSLTLTPTCQVSPANPAYVIYTSGTTGKPKGVVVEHQGVVNMLICRKHYYKLTPGDVALQLFSYAFDGFVTSMFTPTISGAAVIFPGKEEAMDIFAIKKAILNHRVTHFIAVPQFFRGIIETLTCQESTGLKTVTLAGDNVSGILLENTHKTHPHLEITIEYGVTEASVMSTICWHQEKKKKVTIGKPIGNTYIFILGHQRQLQPIGVVGELCISGTGPARGYLNQPELTAEKFERAVIRHSLLVTSSSLKTNGRLYRTGDLARWLPDGNIEFLGRIDNQVKIRGFRIELGEIENRLLNHKNVKEAVAIVREERGKDKCLCAYIVPHHMGAFQETELRAHLAAELPDYMIPTYFVPLEKMPLNTIGKIDRKVLPGPGMTNENSYVPPENKIQKNLVKIWSEVLGRSNPIGINDNFFKLGGHSLMAAIMTAHIHRELDVKIPLVEIFNNSSIKRLAAYINKSKKSIYKGIRPVEKRDYYPQSSAQKRLFLLDKLEDIHTSYNIPVVLKVEGIVKRETIENAFRTMIERHESLRTSFRLIGSEPVQRVHDKVEFKIENNNLQVTGASDRYRWEKAAFGGQSPKSQELRAKSYIYSFIRPFDLSQAPLLRVGLTELPQTPAALHGILIIDMHHIVSDGTSMSVLVKEFIFLNEGKTLSPLNIQYKDFSCWQNQLLKAGKLKTQEVYWLKLLGKSEDIPALNIPGDFKRPAVQSFGGNVLKFELEEDTAARLKTMALKEDVTLYLLFLAIYNIFLSKLSSQEDIIVGTPVASRRHADLQQVIGMFVNTLALRNKPSGKKSFNKFLKEAKEKTLAAFENQEYPFAELVENLSITRDASRNPLFDVMFVLQNVDTIHQEIPGMKLTPFETENNISKFDLTLQVIESGEKLILTFEYCTKLFGKETIHRFIKYFKKIVYSVLDDPEQEIANMEILSEEEKHRLLYKFNDTKSQYPNNKTLDELFKEQAEQAPGHIAVVGSLKIKYRTYMTYISYRQLNDKSNQLAYLLKQKGVKSDMIVAILMERSIEMIIGLLGILKAGGAYLPIDPDYPGERIKYMLKDSGAEILLNDSDFKPEAFNNCPKGTASHLDLHLPPWVNSSPTSLAYIIYTSGTTGKPKGNLTTHANVIRVVKNTNYIELTGSHRVLQLSNYAFDGSVFDIYGALLNGSVLVLVERDKVLALDQLAAFIIQQQITLFFVTTALFNTLVDLQLHCFANIRKVLFGGERVSPEHTRKALAYMGKGRIIHVYGPTETTVYATYYFIDEIAGDAVTIPIGMPITDTTAYILDKYLRVVPIGVTGELYIGGEGLARGYLNKPELTSEKFNHDLWDYQDYHDKKTNSFCGALCAKRHAPCAFPMAAAGKIYKTGDLVRRLTDGNIEFIGRIDGQIKIRGFRIEPGEIESRLLSHDKIKETVVLAREDNGGEKYLCAYFVSKHAVTAPRLREYLSKSLPDYMIPSYFILLEKIPLTPNGKVDRKALPVPGLHRGENYAAPGDEIEKQLVKIWAQVLGRDALHATQLYESIGIHDNFFELGGHSLKATIMAAKIHKALNVKIPLTEIFVNPTIKTLTRTIKAAAADQYASIKPVEEKEYYELSPAQKRLYVLQQMQPTVTSYNLPAVFEMEGVADITTVEEAVRKLIESHESFRTSFQMVQGTPVQRIHRHVEFRVEYYGAECMVQSAKHEAQSINQDKERCVPGAVRYESFTRPFDLTRAPLLRVGLMELPHTPDALRGRPSREGRKYRYILMIDMHHISADGTSLEVFINDFMILYEGNQLHGLRIQYKDYSEWQNEEKQTQPFKQQERYWLNQFTGEIPALNLPLDYPRPIIQSFKGKTLHFEIREDKTTVLKSLVLKEGVTLFMLLLSITNILLLKLSNQEEIIIGTPIAARRHPDLQPVIGMFVNTLALPNKPRAEKIFKQFLMEVKENTLKAYENQEYPFEELVEKVSVPRDASRNPLFDVMFILQNMEMTEIEIPGLKLKPYEYEQKTSKFDLTLTAVETGNKLLFSMGYCTKLFKEETIIRLITYFKKILFSIQEDPGIKISGISIIPEEEKQRILNHFNETSTRYAAHKSLHELFREQAKQTPDNIAVVGSSQIKYRTYMTYMAYISYRELNDRSNQLEYLLKEKGVKPDTIVGLMVERTAKMVIGILGILKANGAYLPIDPHFPAERINYMLADSGTKILVTTQDITKKIEFEKEIIYLSHAIKCVSTQSHLHLPPAPATSLAYVIYTSGSTGKPKGVMIHHQAIHNFIIGMTQRIDFTPGKTILALTTISFDIFVLETLLPLFHGMRIIIADEHQQLDINLLEELIVKTGVDMLQATPTRMQMFTGNGRLTSCLENLKEIMVGGEPFPVKLLRDLEQLTSARIYNMYGPTETTVWSTMKDLTPGTIDEINIGRPIANTQIYILDKNDQPQPLGIIGDLYIGGHGLARGYINRPGLTTEKFCLRRPGGLFSRKPPPWTPHKSFLLASQRINMSDMSHRSYIYKTGDLARWLSDGNIEFFGRIDSQVKIRGFRVELEEIEKHLLACPDIKEAVVIDRADTNNNKFLCAYLVLKNTPDIEMPKIKEFLSQSLPGYMVPSYFVPLDKIPLTGNNKVNRKSLPPIDGIRLPLHRKEGYAAPGTDIEKLIADIWKDVLKLEKIGLDDNFFDIGGNSLNMVQLNNKLNNMFDKKLAVIIMFRYTTIRSLAQFLQSLQPGQAQYTGEKLGRKKRASAQNQGKHDRQQRYQKRKKIATKINRK